MFIRALSLAYYSSSLCYRLYPWSCTGCPWELLYADDLIISAVSMKELLVKLKTWKAEMQRKGLPVNMEKTKIMVSGLILDLLKKSGKDPCDVCQTGVGRHAIFCGGCLSWIHKKCREIKGPLHPDPDFRCVRCLAKARPIDGRVVKVVQVDDQKFEAVPEFCLGDMLSTGRGCEQAAVTLQIGLRQVLPTTPHPHQPQSATFDQRSRVFKL